jgi:hypothetical protein
MSELHALYREAATEEPGPLLDRNILDAARAEVQPAIAPRRQRPRWQSWFAATSAVAVAVLGLSLTWRVMDEQEQALRQEISAGQAAPDTVSRSAPAEVPPAAKPSRNAQAPAVDAAVVRSKAAAPALDATVAQSKPGAPTPAPAPAPAEPLAFPGAPAASAPAEASAQKSRRAEADQMRETRDASAASSAAPASALGKLTVAAPEAWLQQIRELRAAGRIAEAAQSLARFRGRYPDFVLPDDLANLK